MSRKLQSPTGNAGPRMTRRTFAAGVGALGLVAGTAPFSIVRAAGGPLKVGVILPRSGYMAGIGQDCQRGVDIAAPILKSLGYPELQIMNADTESSVDTARSRAEQLIGDGAQLLVGAFDSGETAAIAQVAEQKGIPLVINIAAAPQITEQGYKYVFRNFPTAPTILGDAFANQMELFGMTGASPKTAVFLHVNDTFGTAMAKGIGVVSSKFPLPYKIVQEIAYDPATRDLSVEVAKAKAAKPDVLLVVSRLNDAILMTRELIKQRWTPEAVLSMGPGWYEDQYLKTLGKYSDGPDQLRALVRPQQEAEQDAGSRPCQGRSGREPQHQPHLHLRGADGRRRCLQARRLGRSEGAHRGHPHHRHHRQCQHRPGHQVRCQGPECQRQGRCHPEPRRQAGDHRAEGSGQCQARMADEAV